MEQWLSLPGDGGDTEAVTHTLNRLAVGQFRSDTYELPLKLAQFSYVIDKLPELSVMWAFGGSATWSRDRSANRSRS